MEKQVNVVEEAISELKVTKKEGNENKIRFWDKLRYNKKTKWSAIISVISILFIACSIFVLGHNWGTIHNSILIGIHLNVAIGVFLITPFVLIFSVVIFNFSLSPAYESYLEKLYGIIIAVACVYAVLISVIIHWLTDSWDFIPGFIVAVAGAFISLYLNKEQQNQRDILNTIRICPKGIIDNRELTDNSISKCQNKYQIMNASTQILGKFLLFSISKIGENYVLNKIDINKQFLLHNEICNICLEEDIMQIHIIIKIRGKNYYKIFRFNLENNIYEDFGKLESEFLEYYGIINKTKWTFKNKEISKIMIENKTMGTVLNRMYDLEYATKIQKRKNNHLSRKANRRRKNESKDKA